MENKLATIIFQVGGDLGVISRGEHIFQASQLGEEFPKKLMRKKIVVGSSVLAQAHVLKFVVCSSVWFSLCLVLAPPIQQSRLLVQMFVLTRAFQSRPNRAEPEFDLRGLGFALAPKLPTQPGWTCAVYFVAVPTKLVLPLCIAVAINSFGFAFRQVENTRKSYNFLRCPESREEFFKKMWRFFWQAKGPSIPL